MDLASQIIPAMITLMAAVFSGSRSSFRWEIVTAIFGWTAVVSILLVVVSWPFAVATGMRPFLYQLIGFSLITAIGRDYEKMLAPLFRWNR